MLRLRSRDASFELDIERYEFDAALDYDDANWLVVKIVGSDQQYQWSATDSCLLTYELKELYDWVSSLGSLIGETSSISFLEGELGFEFEKTTNELSIVLNFNFHPKGRSFQYGEDGDERYIMKFQLSNGLGHLLLGIKTLIDKFPERLKHKRDT
ncbi:MAG: hypothetical protein N0C84_23980 [Candidatus Thiodiazotropha taylori]|uniref:Uncharacterized protein n=1 Tax=Candidatus Thiodiazotropha taylori TaxID=2792791 RepID=A0A9E4N8H7_9GAMM|nr:hypothetical protein [Candidatus Thiodiazotropha sp. (ex Lucina pensylvanica)]MBT3053550.1 hypothetical protein [Candidatus Thiodiazotropha sp. (ex Codakia orbicularis)]MCG7949403.1 hypothetical protein [Candidatus Thiodiazotropha taylori]MCW4259530.1 hypothetical protein [Candidatus Thiodiazotropha taylori]